MQTKLKRGVNRTKLKAISRRCCDHFATDQLDRAMSRGAVSQQTVKRIAQRCDDPQAVDALVYA